MTTDKIKTIDEAVRIAAEARAAGKVVVTTNGCYDVLHVGHVKNLEWARTQGDILIVGVNSDRSVAENKGPLRPIIPAAERAVVIASLAAVDYVFIFDTKVTPPWIREVKPSIHVKGEGSEAHADFPEMEAAVREGGGCVVLAPNIPGRSTTDIISTISERYPRTG